MVLSKIQTSFSTTSPTLGREQVSSLPGAAFSSLQWDNFPTPALVVPNMETDRSKEGREKGDGEKREGERGRAERREGAGRDCRGRSGGHEDPTALRMNSRGVGGGVNVMTGLFCLQALRAVCHVLSSSLAFWLQGACPRSLSFYPERDFISHLLQPKF